MRPDSRAAQAALELTRGLREEDCVLFLISGGGSALFESPLVPLAELEDITGQLLSCGADIVEINTIRKRRPRQGRAVALPLPSGAGLLGRAVGYSRRPARHDRLRPCSAGQQHVRRGAGRRAEIRAAPV